MFHVIILQKRYFDRYARVIINSGFTYIRRESLYAFIAVSERSDFTEYTKDKKEK